MEEAKRIEDVMKLQLEEKERENQRLEIEIVGLRRKIEKSKDHVKFNENSVILDEILKCQRLSSDKSCLGFKKEDDKLKEVLGSPRTLEAESNKAIHTPAHSNKEVENSKVPHEATPTHQSHSFVFFSGPKSNIESCTRIMHTHFR